MREEAKLQKEIEEQRRKLEKEQTHYLNALAKLRLQLVSNPNDADLLAKQQEIELQLTEIDKGIKDVDYREANKRAGYVYVISNIGAFGENIYKIGMTRRLDPMERVDELGDASVPFDFDVHALIFSEDAPKLEAALHKAFEDKKVNFVNHRREFFNVTLQEIKDVVTANYDKTVEWNDYADAEQYRISLKMKGLSAPENPVKPSITSNAPISETVESISEKLKEIGNKKIADFVCQEEDAADFIRLHLYSSNNMKYGTIKILKANKSISLRKIINGVPTSYDLKDADDFINYV